MKRNFPVQLNYKLLPRVLYEESVAFFEQMPSEFDESRKATILDDAKSMHELDELLNLSYLHGAILWDNGDANCCYHTNLTGYLSLQTAYTILQRMNKQCLRYEMGTKMRLESITNIYVAMGSFFCYIDEREGHIMFGYGRFYRSLHFDDGRMDMDRVSSYFASFPIVERSIFYATLNEMNNE